MTLEAEVSSAHKNRVEQGVNGARMDGEDCLRWRFSSQNLSHDPTGDGMVLQMNPHANAGNELHENSS